MKTNWADEKERDKEDRTRTPSCNITPREVKRGKDRVMVQTKREDRIKEKGKENRSSEPTIIKANHFTIRR